MWKNIDESKLNFLQCLTIEKFGQELKILNVKSLLVSADDSVGAHANYKDLTTYLITINIVFSEVVVNMYIDHDQLEYYILNNNEKILSKCILEAYDTEKKLIDIYFKAFRKDCLKYDLYKHGK